MVSRTHVTFKADDRSYFAILKKQIHSLAISAGFSENKVGEIDIVVAELVSNLVKHAGGGDVLVKLIEENNLQGIEIISIDNGKGIGDLARMMSDGASTKNTLGQGLGAMKRMSEVFQIYSLKDWGTIVLIRIFEDELPHFRKPAKVEVKSVIIAKPGEITCGDGFYWEINPEYIKIFLGDGLGHGAEAAKAVEAAIESVEKCKEVDPAEIIRQIHNDVRKTRGLVGTVAIFNLREKTWRTCGVGNIGTKINTGGVIKGYMSYNGIIGLNVPRTLHSQVTEYEKGQFIMMCSDGIKSRWDNAKHPSISRYDLSILSAALLKDFARYTDDMSIAVCKPNF